MEYIPDPLEIMDSNIERNIENYIEGHCMGCGKNVGEDNLVLATPSPDSPAVCFKCASFKPKAFLGQKK